MNRRFTSAWRLLSTAMAVSVAIAVAACGGSSGGGNPPPANNVNNTNSTNNTNVNNTNANNTNANNNNTPACVDPQVAPPAANTMRFHYQRADKNYNGGWGVYVWMGATVLSSSHPWPGDPRYALDHTDCFGIWGDMPLAANATEVQFLLNTSNGGSQTSDYDFKNVGDVSTAGKEIWIINGDTKIYETKPGVQVAAGGKAYWISANVMAWQDESILAGVGLLQDPTHTLKLYTAANAGIAVSPSGVTGSDQAFDVTYDAGAADLSAAELAKYPGARGVRLTNAMTADQVKAALKGQVMLVETDASGTVVAATQPQLQGVLDDLYAANAAATPLGLSFAATTRVPTFAVWAPTAKSVKLKYYADANTTASTLYDMTLDANTGIWSYTAADASWNNSAYYTFIVQVYSHVAGDVVVTNEVTDPYSISLNGKNPAADGLKRSMVVDLDSAATQPSGWPGTLIPTAAVPTDAVVYELHVRDFSWNDDSVTDPNLKGKFLAFTQDGLGQPWSAAGTVSKGMKHLQDLSHAGLTHVHLLPTFEFTSVPQETCNPTITIPPFTSPSDLGPQTAVNNASANDCYNWGYDPWHYGAPEGSYASDPNDGLKRVVEFRKMIQALHGNGLRVVMDVVYNHTFAKGQANDSVLDRIVPNYYHRMDISGNEMNQSCCADTATEFKMMERLVTDTVSRWADKYKVDAFRFDIMDLQPKQQMVNTLAAVDQIPAGDGRGHTYFYGEGWVAPVPFTGASQNNMAGTHIGTFNDRIRSPVRGESGTSVSHSGQAFISGWCYDPNDANTTCAAGSAAESTLFQAQNRIRVGLAGGLKDYQLTSSITGQMFGGYTLNPEESVAYVSVHDNEDLWDMSQYKHPDATSGADRARAQVVGLSVPVLAQGVAFLHAGDELLRSKSMDGNSYNSGDWFNRIYWDGSKNNFGVGLPPQGSGSNPSNTAAATHALNLALDNSGIGPKDLTQAHILAASAAFQDYLTIRKQTSLFRLTSSAQVKACVKFPDMAAQKQGLVVEQIGDGGTTTCGDGTVKSVVVLFNGNKVAQTYTIPFYAGKTVALHPAHQHDPAITAQTATFDSATGTFTAPPRSTVVWVQQ